MRNEMSWEKIGRNSQTDLLHETPARLSSTVRHTLAVLPPCHLTFHSLSAVGPLTAELDQNKCTFLHPEITAIVLRNLHGLWSRPIPSSFSLPTHQISAWGCQHRQNGGGWTCDSCGYVCCLHRVSFFSEPKIKHCEWIKVWPKEIRVRIRTVQRLGPLPFSSDINDMFSTHREHHASVSQVSCLLAEKARGQMWPDPVTRRR